MRSLFLMGALSLALVLCACGRTHYVRNDGEDASEREAKDYMECLYEAQKATGNLSEENDDRDDRIEEMTHNCMGLKGYVED